MIEVHYPIDLLKCGFDIYDGPGTSESDVPAVRAFFARFLKVIRPVPIFLYSNGTFADAEFKAVEVLRESIPMVRDLPVSILFISTYMDMSGLRAAWPDLKDNLAAAADNEAEKRYQQIKERAIMNSLPFADLLQASHASTCPFFACIGALDVLNRIKGWEAPFGRTVRAFSYILLHRLVDMFRRSTSCSLTARS